MTPLGQLRLGLCDGGLTIGVVIRIPSRVKGPGADASAPYARALPSLYAGFDAFQELPEQRLGVVRSWRSLGMILNGEHRQRAMA